MCTDTTGNEMLVTLIMISENQYDNSTEPSKLNSEMQCICINPSFSILLYCKTIMAS